MPDRETVISELELAVSLAWNSDEDQCEIMDADDAMTVAHAILDALTLLKADQSVIDQIEWERNTALEQLAEVDKSLGEKMDDLRELTQKRGRWVRLTGMAPPEYHGHKVCSLCDCMAPHDPIHIANEILTPYCPGCGAEMECDDGN